MFAGRSAIVPRSRRPLHSHVRPAEVRRASPGHRALPGNGRRISRPGRHRSKRLRSRSRLRIAGRPIPHRPLARAKSCAATTALAIQRIKIPKGELSSDHLAKIADLAEMYGDKYVYSTNRQNLELHGVDPKRLPQLRSEIQAIATGNGGFFRPKRRGELRGHDLLPVGRLDHASHVRHAARPGPRREIRDDPRQGADQHHRLPEFLLAVSHRRHRHARAADPRNGRLDRRLSDDRRRHAAEFRPAGRRVQARRLRARDRHDSRYVHAIGRRRGNAGRKRRPIGHRALSPGGRMRWASDTKRRSIRWNFRS